MSKLFSAEDGPGQIKLLSFLVLICKLSLIWMGEDACVTRQLKNNDIWNFSLNELLIVAQIVFSISKNAHSFHIKCLKQPADFYMNMQQKMKYTTCMWTG